MNNFEDLLAHAGIEQAQKTTEINLRSWPLQGLSNNVAADFLRLHTARNGWYAFEAALWIYPFASQSKYSIESINSLTSLQSYPPEVRAGLVFGSDLIGSQFAVDEGGYWSIDLETAERQFIGKDLDSWANEILADIDYRTAHRLGHEWQTEHGAILPGCRLGPKVPFILGGEYSTENLVSIDALELIGFRANLYQQIRDLPAGSPVEWKITP